MSLKDLFVSKRSKEFESFSDDEVIRQALNWEADRKRLLQWSDEGMDVEAELDGIDAKLSRLDDELCARNLDWPKG